MDDHSIIDQNIAEIQQEEAAGLISHDMATELEQLNESLTPDQQQLIAQQEQTMASLPPDQAQAYQQEVIAAETQSAQNSFDATMQQAEQFDQSLRSS